MHTDKGTVYIKIAQNVLVKFRSVKMEDIASITGTNETMIRQIKQMRIYLFQEQKDDKRKKIQRTIFSILKIIECIQKEYPNAQIVNEGEKDFIIEFNPCPEQGKFSEICKTIIVGIFVFFGAAFTIMAFNNDISIEDVFSKFYYQITGMQSDGVTEIEISYCIGLAIGILLFFNHVGRKKITPDPTPIQVEMRKYEQDVDTTFIENAGRGGREEDVS